MAKGGRARKERWIMRLKSAGMLAALGLTIGLTLPAWQVLAEKTAVAAVGLTLPESGLYRLRQRFASEVLTQKEEQPGQPPEKAEKPVQPSEETEPRQSSGSQQQDAAEEPIPEEYQGTLLHETMLGEAGGSCLNLGTAWLRNYTALSLADIQTVLAETPLLSISKGQPQVLIIHTHATESYETHTGDAYDTRSSWRTLDNSENVCAIGEIIAQQLQAAGIGVIHDTTLHDYPSYNGSYDRSRETVNAILVEHPTISVILDIHRDAIQRNETTIVAPVTEIGGRQCAQVMVIAGCDDGTLNIPNWRQNLRFAAELLNQMEADWPTLTRPLFFAHRKYNQDMAPTALLIEVGSSGNTFEEAEYAAQLTGRSLCKVLKRMEE